MTKSNYHIRNMTATEVQDIAIEWAAREGWNPGLQDASCFYQADPNGFFLGLLNDEPIASISAVAYDHSFAFIGFYIVKPDFRGKGYGFRIWQRAFEYLQDQNIALDGVIEQQDGYRKSGFKLAYSNLRYQGKAFSLDHRYAHISSINDVSMDELAQYDSQYFPTERKRFLECWLKQNNSYGFVSRQGQIINGYTLIRQCREGYKIGPLFAESPDGAEALFRSALHAVPENSNVYLDIPEVNAAARAMVRKYQMKQIFGTARMYTGQQPDIDQNKVFGVTSFELG